MLCSISVAHIIIDKNEKVQESALITTLFDKIDKNKDGVITQSEFIRFANSIPKRLL